MAVGEVIAYPTEAVWGLGCDPLNPYAVEKLLALKQRPVEKGLILIAAELNQFSSLLENLTANQLQQLAAPQTKPITWLVPASATVPAWIKGNHSSVAIRLVKHPVAAALCRLVGGPIVSTSANPGTRREARTALAVRRYFGNQLAAICPGKVGPNARPSEIRDLASGQVIRPGG